MLFKGGDIKSRIVNFVHGYYHMWFILMIIGLYLCIPIINMIVQSKEACKVFLILAFVFAFLLPEINTILHDFGVRIVIITDAIFESIDNMRMNIVLGFPSLFILGYYLKNDMFNFILKKKIRFIIYIAGFFGAMFTAFMTSWISLRTAQPCSNYYDSFSVNVLMQSIALFVLFKNLKLNSVKMNYYISVFSKCTFGVYLIHPLVMELLQLVFALDTFIFNPIMSVLLISLIVFVISFVLSLLLNKIPFLRRYIV